MDANFAIQNSIPIPYAVLQEQYRAYSSPKDKISRLVAEGDLIRLKKGLFLPNANEGNVFPPLELIANIMRGPSYVSLQTALSFYGLIPERVFAVRSMTTKRSKTYHTPVGRFEYVTAKAGYFGIGIRSADAGGVSFLIASPEKAICDMIVATARLRLQSSKAMREYIEEDMRIDISDIAPLDLSIFDSVIQAGIKKREIGLLKEYCENAG